MGSPSSPDPYGTAALRATVLDAWRASPSRFREDSNAEEELARGAYRDRVIVELAQNAADAAQQAGVAGRLLVRLDGDRLVVANTGALLDATGVAALSSLRASAKRDTATVGRFGVGFAAVLAVSDEPQITGVAHGVRWSRAEAVDVAMNVPELANEIAARGDAVPVLRLPFPAAGGVPEGYDTCVSLPLRDQRARELAADLVAAVDDALPLALPGLAEIVVEAGGRARVIRVERSPGSVRVATDDRTTVWRLVARSGRVPEPIRAERPVEEPGSWTVTVAVPVGTGGDPGPLPPSVPRVVHAPTPTDDRTDLPVLVVGTFPLDSSRRRIVTGRLTDLLSSEVAAAYTELLTELAEAGAGPRALDLVPGPLAAGEVDAVLHERVVDALGDAALVPSAAGGELLRPRDCVLVEGIESASDPAALAPHLAGMPERSWRRPRSLRRLGAREIGLAEVVDGLSRLSLTPEGWWRLYAALDGADLEALAAIPVPLADGRQVRGARGALTPTGEITADLLARLGIRVVAPGAVHPLLLRLGAIDGTAAAALADPQVRAAIARGDVEVSEAVLDVVAVSTVTVDDEPWLAEVVVPDGAGGTGPAGDLWFPDAPVLSHLDLIRAGDPAEQAVGEGAVERWGRAVLRAVGVRDGFGVARADDLVLDDDVWLDVDDVSGWVDAVRASLPDAEMPPVVAAVVAVRDLDLVRDDAWPDVLRSLSSDRATRSALVESAVAVAADGSRHAVVPYTAWWLRTHARVSGRPLTALCTDDAEPLVRRLLEPVGVTLDPDVCRSIGVARTLADLVAAPQHLLDRLAEPGRTVSAADLIEVYRALAATAVDLDHLPAPAVVRVPSGTGSALVPAEAATVADGPYWLQLGLGGLLAGSERLAEVLDIDLAAEAYDTAPPSGGRTTPVPASVAQLVPMAPVSYVEHDDLVVAGQAVDWWVFGTGTVHASTVDGLARGLAWVSGAWARRFEIAMVLDDADSVGQLLDERLFDPW